MMGAMPDASARRTEPIAGRPAAWVLSLVLNGALGVVGIVGFFFLAWDVIYATGLAERPVRAGDDGPGVSLLISGVVLVLSLGVTALLQTVFRTPGRAF